MSTPAIFFDRDGIVNRRLPDNYVKRIEEFEFLPDVSQAVRMVHDRGYLAIVVTNQRGIGRGLMTEEDLEGVHAWMQNYLRDNGGHRFDAIYHCPHDTVDGCACRKPRPGMLHTAAADLGVDLNRSWIIGDSESDVEAGLAAGCRAVLVAPKGTRSKATHVSTSLLDGVETILNWEERY